MPPAKKPARKAAKPKPKTVTWGTLAKELGIDQRSLHRWRKFDGAPKTTDAAAWKVYIEANELGVTGNRKSAGREHWLTLKAKNDTVLQAIKIAKEHGQVVAIESVDALLGKIALNQKALLYAKLENEMPHTLTGMTAPEMRKKLRKAADQICDTMRKEVDRWRRDIRTKIQTTDES